VHPDDWFFRCHFLGDPVQPGCLGLDAVWQLVGFFCAWRGGLGVGRALGCGEVAFEGQIRPTDRVVRYEVTVRRHATVAEATLAIADARVLVDGTPIYGVKGARVGLFPALARDGRLLRASGGDCTA
jgi:3-hydroxyacyl-[acyl-carrier protein] dehydratase/trans-2-decenoyl-[acyl-carrier protein] isomerase